MSLVGTAVPSGWSVMEGDEEVPSGTVILMMGMTRGVSLEPEPEPDMVGDDSRFVSRMGWRGGAFDEHSVVADGEELSIGNNNCDESVRRQEGFLGRGARVDDPEWRGGTHDHCPTVSSPPWCVAL